MSLPVRKRKLLLVGAGNLCLQILKILGPKNAFEFVVLGRNEEATIRLCNLVALSCAQLGQFIDIKPVIADLTDIGKVTRLSEGFLLIEIAINVEVQIQRSAVVHVLPKGTAK